MTRDRWAPILGLDGYEASVLGGVRSVDRVLSDGRFCDGVVLAQRVNAGGYLVVTIGGRPYHVARLVLLAWGGEPRPGYEALHSNGRRNDCRLSNLRWGSKSTNAKDRERHKRQRLGRSTRLSLVTAAT
jgi:hypothetical protein